MALPDYYAVLGVLPTAPDDEITRAWRRLVLAVSGIECELMVDRNGGDGATWRLVKLPEHADTSRTLTRHDPRPHRPTSAS